ncbi:MAG: glycosyltransferase family 2 protein [Immundisolibacteraceae bacterium]|nr:glycosyltransferase family 2 protein [Immundisolibacteraceae bacterium]
MNSLLAEGLMQLFFIYMLYVFGGYAILNLLALFWLRHNNELREYLLHETRLTGQEPGVAIIVPAYNEGTGIVSSVRSLLQQEYGSFEIIVINDGSSDNTLESLIQEFDLYEFPQAYCQRFQTAPIRKVYRSRIEHRLRVVDKENGGSKADAANAGLNIAMQPLVCFMDADEVLDRHALLRTVQFFLDDKAVIACGGTLRPLNGCQVENGNLIRDEIPRNPWALFQTVEYLRSFLCGRIGWGQLNSVLIISGGYGVFRTDLTVEAGGFDKNMLGEDMDLVLRLHQLMLKKKVPYKIHFLPETTCWTEVPESLGVFKNQRARWQRGLMQCLWAYRSFFFSFRAPAIGWLAMPFFLLVECLSPLVELVGIVMLIYLFSTSQIEPTSLLTLGLFALTMSMLLSTTSVMLNSITPGNKTDIRSTMILMGTILLEPLIYHPVHTFCRLIGMLQWLRGSKPNWGTMTRTGNWQNS